MYREDSYHQQRTRRRPRNTELKNRHTKYSNGREYKVLAIGDGTDDIPMIKASALGVAIKTNNNSNVVENADVVMDKFYELKNL